MNDNAQSAKIYVYTNSGGKYFTTSDTELANLKKLGIRNIYKSTKKKVTLISPIPITFSKFSV